MLHLLWSKHNQIMEITYSKGAAKWGRVLSLVRVISSGHIRSRHFNWGHFKRRDRVYLIQINQFVIQVSPSLPINIYHQTNKSSVDFSSDCAIDPKFAFIIVILFCSFLSCTLAEYVFQIIIMFSSMKLWNILLCVCIDNISMCTVSFSSVHLPLFMIICHHHDRWSFISNWWSQPFFSALV